jgi:hypothetical protein
LWKLLQEVVMVVQAAEVVCAEAQSVPPVVMRRVLVAVEDVGSQS